MEGFDMGLLRKGLGFATLGAAKVAAKRAWESEDYIESALSAAEAGFWADASMNWLEGEFDPEEEEQDRFYSDY